MAIKMLKCGICGGILQMQTGGQEAICSCCGLSYSVERVREIYAGMKVSVTGTDVDVHQWKELTKTYLENCDYSAAEQTVKKILEALPQDEYANELYRKL